MSLRVSQNVYLVALSRLPGIGPKTLVSLVNFFGSPFLVFEQIKKLGLSPKNFPFKPDLILKIRECTDFDSIEKELEASDKNGIHFLTYLDDTYPPQLKQIEHFPPLLYYRGRLECLNNVEWIGVVGTRKATDYGLQVCRQLVTDLVDAGVGIVSGFANGIDITAHLTCVERGGVTLGVMGTGFDKIYPSIHRKHVPSILKQGMLLTEFEMGSLPLPGCFPRRNRIISGLSRGVLVIEADEKSGALITAHYALEHNRDVFSVPGPVLSQFSRGTNKLIQQGAKLVTKAEDILKEWSYLFSDKKPALTALPPLKPALVFQDPDLEQLYRLCVEKVGTMDDLIEKSGLPSEKVSVFLTRLELDGKIKSLPGGRFQGLG